MTAVEFAQRLTGVTRHGREWRADCPRCHAPTLGFRDHKDSLNIECRHARSDLPSGSRRRSAATASRPKTPRADRRPTALACVPDRGRSPAEAPPRHVPFKRIPHRVRRDRHIRHADLVAVVERRRPAKREEQHGREARLRRPDSAPDARPVVIAEHPVRPRPRRQVRFVLIYQRRDRPSVPGRRDQMKVERSPSLISLWTAERSRTLSASAHDVSSASPRGA